MQKGFIAISSVIIIAAVILAISISVTYLAIGEGQAALATTKGEEALNLAESCMESALLRIRTTPTYSGGTVTQPNGSCTVTIVKAGNNYTLTSTNTDPKYVRSVRVQATRAGTVSITSWKEI